MKHIDPSSRALHEPYPTAPLDESLFEENIFCSRVPPCDHYITSRGDTELLDALKNGNFELADALRAELALLPGMAIKPRHEFRLGLQHFFRFAKTPATKTIVLLNWLPLLPPSKRGTKDEISLQTDSILAQALHSLRGERAGPEDVARINSVAKALLQCGHLTFVVSNVIPFLIRCWTPNDFLDVFHSLSEKAETFLVRSSMQPKEIISQRRLWHATVIQHLTRAGYLREAVIALENAFQADAQPATLDLLPLESALLSFRPDLLTLYDQTRRIHGIEPDVLFSANDIGVLNHLASGALGSALRIVIAGIERGICYAQAVEGPTLFLLNNGDKPVQCESTLPDVGEFSVRRALPAQVSLAQRRDTP